MRRGASHLSALFACACVYMCACTRVCAYACVSVRMHSSHGHWVGHGGGFLLLSGPQVVCGDLLWREILSGRPWKHSYYRSRVPVGCLVPAEVDAWGGVW